MSDRELLDALTVLARRLGLLDPDERLAVEQVPVPEEQALCLAFGVHGAVRLCCTYAKGHVTGDILNAPSAHSWERAMIGKSACIAISGLELPASDPAPRFVCQRPSGHTGEHEATGPDGVRWTWGGALDHCGLCGSEACPGVPGKGCMPTLTTDSPAIRCKDRTERMGNGAYFVCALVNGHEGPHTSASGHRVWGGDSEPDPTEPRAS